MLNFNIFSEFYKVKYMPACTIPGVATYSSNLVLHEVTTFDELWDENRMKEGRREEAQVKEGRKEEEGDGDGFFVADARRPSSRAPLSSSLAAHASRSFISSPHLLYPQHQTAQPAVAYRGRTAPLGVS